MPIVADVVDAVVGGDTHRDTHSLEMVTPAGVTVARTTVSNSDAGYADVLAWIAEHVEGGRVVVALEGTRSYGVGLSRAVQAVGWQVIEAEPPASRGRRAGKSDPLDAHEAALRALRRDMHTLPVPRADGDREALRILLGARHDLSTRKTQTVNRLRALLLTGTDTDRALARAALPVTVLRDLADRDTGPTEGRQDAVRQAEIRRLAQTLCRIHQELTDNDRQLATIVAELAPDLRATRGVGPVTAAQAIVSWSHPGRCRSEAAFASLAGTSPIPASSGRIVRHRLNRGGDRALNRALQTIMLTRWRMCPRTRDYIAKRRSQGSTDPEIRRLLKRYIARELFRTLNNTITP